MKAIRIQAPCRLDVNGGIIEEGKVCIEELEKPVKKMAKPCLRYYTEGYVEVIMDPIEVLSHMPTIPLSRDMSFLLRLLMLT